MTALKQVLKPSIKLYQYAICPFCNINKALLSYVDTPYKIQEVNPLNKSELKWSEYKKVPVATIDGEQINGSKEINDALLKHPFVVANLQQKHDETPASTPMTLEQFTSSGNAERWGHFAREDLAPIIYPNICRSIAESFEAFKYVDHVENFSAVQKVLIRGIGSVAMYFAASKIKSKRNITDERETLKDAISLWEEEGLDKGNKLFSSGLEKPDMGDIAMFGVIHSVSGLKAHDDAILKRDGVILDWYQRMKKEIDQKITVEPYC